MCTVLCAIITSACIDDNDAVETETVSIPVNLYIPVNQEVITKTPGDPGTYEQFALPEYLYIYFVLNYNDGSDTKTQIFRPETIDGVVNLDTEKWSQKKVYTGPLSQYGDFVYEYEGKIDISLPAGKRNWARVYAAVSKVKLTGLDNPTTEAEVTNLKFSLSGAVADSEEDILQRNLRNNLQNLYSSPYNYNISDGESGSIYYGTVKAITGTVPYVNLLLYHVASKVDLIWNVATSQQSSLRITEITAENQFGGQAYLFRPMENVRSTDEAGAYNTTIISNDVGSQWMGRAYYYTIPFKDSRYDNKFCIRTRLRKNGEADKSYLPEFRRDISGSTIFTPWVRGDLTFNTVFTTALDGEAEVDPK
ncbi:MAG: hypothetical protein J5678_07590 [Bacteroidaceae bacterium]|nr:hypothetical protein [Bacteroidaceae bacterium]